MHLLQIANGAGHAKANGTPNCGACLRLRQHARTCQLVPIPQRRQSPFLDNENDMPSDDSTIRVQLFAGAADIAGVRSIEIECHPATDGASQTANQMVTISAVRAELLTRFPELAPLAAFSRFAVDNEFASDETRVSAEHTIALIPPVSGG